MKQLSFFKEQSVARLELLRVQDPVSVDVFKEMCSSSMIIKAIKFSFKSQIM
jgi:hypothetical protein